MDIPQFFIIIILQTIFDICTTKLFQVWYSKEITKM